MVHQPGIKAVTSTLLLITTKHHCSPRRLLLPTLAPNNETNETSLKMDDSPIPEHLIDLLKESGDIDEEGKPVNDFFDPDEDDTFGTQRQRDRITEEVRNVHRFGCAPLR